MKQYPYEVTYSLKTMGNKRFKKRLEASHQGEAKRLFEADMPTANLICVTALPQNKR